LHATVEIEEADLLRSADIVSSTARLTQAADATGLGRGAAPKCSREQLCDLCRAAEPLHGEPLEFPARMSVFFDLDCIRFDAAAVLTPGPRQGM
jgi:hypothetical protein